MYSLTSRILISKVFIKEQTTSELETAFQRKWSDLREDLVQFFSQFPTSDERMEMFENQLEENNRKRFKEIER